MPEAYKPADDCSHAGAGDRIDRHVHLVQYFQHADVGCAACAAATEHQPDARPFAFGGMRSLGEQEHADGQYLKRSHRRRILAAVVTAERRLIG